MDREKTALASTGPTIGLARHVSLQLQARSGRNKVDEAVAAVGIPHPLEVDTSTHISVVQEAAFISAAARSADDLDFGFLAGVTLEAATALPGYIAEHSRTLRDALLDASRFFPVVRPGIQFDVEELGNVATLRLTMADPGLAAYPRYFEAMLAAAIGQIRAFTACPFRPDALSFSHDRIPIRGETRIRLGSSVEFGAEQTEMLISLPVLDRPIRGRDDALHSILVTHGELLEEHARRHGLSFVERVELYLQSCLPDVVPDAEATARILAVSRRTLSRRLMEAETSFADLLAQVRMRAAARELRETKKPIGHIAWELGYGNQSSFSTAFRRATGLTPREFRIGRAIVVDGDDGMHLERH